MCLPRYWINGRGRDQRMNIGGHGRYGQIWADGRKHVLGANMSGPNLTPFFSKNTPKLPFLTVEAQMI
jgi:hypothetical protein